MDKRPLALLALHRLKQAHGHPVAKLIERHTLRVIQGGSMDTVVVSARVPRKLKEALQRHGVNISQVIRRALEEELERIRLEEARKAAKRLAEFLKDIPVEEIVRSIREDRLSR